MVLRNVAKTFSLEEQRQEINEIAVDLDAVNTTLANWNAAQWDTAYSWGDHALAGYATNTALNTAVANSANWDTAYGWGDHALAGYATNTALNTAVQNSANWDTAYGWGDHAQGGYLTAYQTNAQIKSSYEANADTNAFTDALLTKLNGIETSATADQTASEIKTAYESNADTNAFTDAEQTKLAGIASGAEVNLLPGGTYAGTGTAQDPAIGSVQFKNTGNTFGGDSTFRWNNNDNRLSVGTNNDPASAISLPEGQALGWQDTADPAVVGADIYGNNSNQLIIRTGDPLTQHLTVDSTGKLTISTTVIYDKDNYTPGTTGDAGGVSQAAPEGTFQWSNTTPVTGNGGIYKAWIQSGDAYPTASNYIDVLIQNGAMYRITIKGSHSSATADMAMFLIFGLANNLGTLPPVVEKMGDSNNSFSTSVVSYNINPYDTVLRISYSGNNNQGLFALIERVY